MNKKLLIAGGILILLLLGFLYYKSTKKGAIKLVSQTPETVQTTASSSSLKDLLSKGVAQSCSFDSAGTNGKVYISDGKVRGDFDTSTEKVTTKSHMIVMDSTSYIWTDNQKTGFKMSFDVNATPVPGLKTQTSTTQGLDTNTSMNYNCSPWVTDATMFNLPSGVTFTSFAVPQQGASVSGSAPSSQCSYCDSLTGNDKTQCLTALNCK